MVIVTVTAPNGRRVISELDASLETVYKWCSEHWQFESGKWIKDNLTQGVRLRNLARVDANLG